MAEVERLCDFVGIMRRGAIVEKGEPIELMRHYGCDTLREAYLAICAKS
jgi:ABC-type multidrug transport system ATPase subunit